MMSLVQPAGAVDGAEVAAALGGDARIDAPGQERAEQQDRAEIAIRQQMRQRPGLHARPASDA